MNIKLPSILLGLGVLSLPLIANTTKVNAFMYGQHNNTNMLQKFVKRFNLNKTEVDKFIAEQRKINQDVRLKTIEIKLNELVASNKLNANQKNELLNLIKEHQKQLSALSFNDKDAMLKLKQAHREQIRSWASNNNINLYSLNIFGTNLMGKQNGRMGRGL